jgi:hypothetical protein
VSLPEIDANVNRNNKKMYLKKTLKLKELYFERIVAYFCILLFICLSSMPFEKSNYKIKIRYCKYSTHKLHKYDSYQFERIVGLGLMCLTHISGYFEPT